MTPKNKMESWINNHNHRENSHQYISKMNHGHHDHHDKYLNT
jgi:hypothetical protein